LADLEERDGPRERRRVELGAPGERHRRLAAGAELSPRGLERGRPDLPEPHQRLLAVVAERMLGDEARPRLPRLVGAPELEEDDRVPIGGAPVQVLGVLARPFPQRRLEEAPRILEPPFAAPLP